MARDSMPIDRRTALRATAGLATAGLGGLAGCSGGGDGGSGTDTATDTTATSQSSLPSVVHGAVKGGTTGVLVNVMNDQGFDKEFGIDVTPKYFTSPPKVQKQIVLNKDIPTGFMGSIVATRLNAKGHKPRLVGPYMLYHMYVLTKEGTGIEGPEDLKGKKISWASKAADAWLKFEVILNMKTGLTPSDLEFVQTAPPASISLLEKGELDAILLHEPLVTKALAKFDSFKVVFNPRKVWREAMNMPITTVDLAWDGNWFNENKEKGTALAKATKKTQNYIQSNIDKSVEKYQDSFGLTTDKQLKLGKKRLDQVYPSEWNQSEFINSEMEMAKRAQKLGLIDTEPTKEIFDWVL